LKTLRIDIETRSDADLKKTGVYRYAESEHFKVLLFGYAFDGEPTVDVDLEQGQELPPRILDAIDNPEIIKTAFNANFEIVCLSRHFGRQLDPAQWRCTAVHASYLGMPNNLADVAKVVGLPEDLQKMGVGWQLIRYFCMPCKPTKVNGGRTWNLPRHDPAKWKLFREYCRRDVDVERAIARKFEKYPFPEREQKLWVIDQEINNRGIKVDTELVERAIEMDAAVKSRLISEAIGLTGLDNVNSRDQLIGWLESAQGEEIESLTKDDVPDLISRAANGEVRRVLEIRQEMAKTSVRKYQALSSAVCADRRVRGLHQFYGANRTGRWAGRIVQPQNLPQNKLLDLDVAREMLRAGDLNMLASLFGSVPDTLSQLIRTMFIGDFRIVDFSAIEARVIAWLADCRWRMDVFDTHGKIYEASAEQMFKLPPGSVKKGDPMRQKGKISELALGYQGGKGALVTMGALDMGLTEEELPGLVVDWRTANPEIVTLWHSLGDAAIKAVGGKTDVVVPVANGRSSLVFSYGGGFLTLALPSGRKLHYVKPLIESDDFGRPQLTYEGIDQKTRRWFRLKTYGGKLVENVTQAIARDCLAETLLQVPNVVMHVHDEVIAEGGMDLAEIETVMAKPIAWAPGLKLTGDGFTHPYYRKE
jgi:DNA polymerase bacteriophage-type